MDDIAVDHLVGSKLRRLRKASAMSIQTLAQLSDRSIGYISQIERGISSATLRDIAVFTKALGVSFNELLRGPFHADAEGPVRSDSERVLMDFRGTGITKRVLAPQNQGSIDFYLMTIEGGGSTGELPYSHDGEEAGFVLKGMLQISIGGQEYQLTAGDSFRFSSRTAHGFRNNAIEPAEVLWINVGSNRNDKP